MKNRMRGRAQKFVGKREQVRRPRAGRKNNRFSADAMSISQDNAFDAIIAFNRCSEFSLPQFDAPRLGVTDECRDNAAALDMTGVGIKKAVLKSVRIERRKTLVKGKRIEPLQ